VVWTIFTDVEAWPSWTASVSRIEPLDGAGLEIGRRFRISQPKLPVLVWTITDVSPGRSWRWETTSVGARTSATHTLAATPHGHTVVTQCLEQTGWLGRPVAALTRRLTRRYLQLEANGLKRASEHRVAPQT
jgi:hypothetical protein